MAAMFQIDPNDPYEKARTLTTGVAATLESDYPGFFTPPFPRNPPAQPYMDLGSSAQSGYC